LNLVNFDLGPLFALSRTTAFVALWAEWAQLVTTLEWSLFIHLKQNNVLDSKKWESQEVLRIAIFTWIEGIDHRRRSKRSLGKLTPVEYEVAHEVIDKELLAA
jgi:transposase InsO family protein